MTGDHKLWSYLVNAPLIRGWIRKFEGSINKRTTYPGVPSSEKKLYMNTRALYSFSNYKD